MMDTAELIKKCSEKDSKAWNEFVRRYMGIVTRAVRYKLGNLGASYAKADVHDIVQEIFLVIWEKDRLSGIKSAESVRGWLAIVSINFTVHYCRKNIFKNGNRCIPLDSPCNEETGELTLRSIIPSSSDVLEELKANDLSQIINSEISKLAHKQQLALKLNIFDGMKQKEIAAIMNIPEGTVAILISRGKKYLRNALETLDIRRG